MCVLMAVVVLISQLTICCMSRHIRYFFVNAQALSVVFSG